MEDNLSKFNILWVDDETEKMEPLLDFFGEPQEGAGKTCQLIFDLVGCWEEAETKLRHSKGHKDYKDYVALVLDAKCKIKKEDKEDIEDFISNVKDRLRELNIRIPYFFFSGQGNNSLLRKQRWYQTDPDCKWKDDHDRAFYIKPQDREALRKNLIDYVINIGRYRIMHVLYPDLFKAITELKLDKCVMDNLIDLLEPIHFGNANDLSYNEQKSKIRLSIEHIFRSMHDNGMLPQSNVNHQNTGRVNINSSFNHLSEFFLPQLTKGFITQIKYLISVALHTSPFKDCDFRSYTESIKSTFLLRSLTFWLGDFILWYYHFQKVNEKEDNIKKWEGKIEQKTFKGQLKWNEEKSIWTITSDNEKPVWLDNQEPGAKDHNYDYLKEGAWCTYEKKKINNHFYAHTINIILNMAASYNFFAGEGHDRLLANVVYRILMSGKSCSYADFLTEYLHQPLDPNQNLSDHPQYPSLKKAVKRVIGELRQRLGEKCVITSGNKRSMTYQYVGEDIDPLYFLRTSVRKGLSDYCAFCRDSAGFIPDSWLKYFLKDTIDLYEIYWNQKTCKSGIVISHSQNMKNIDQLPILYDAIKNKKLLKINYIPYEGESRTVYLSPHFLREFNGRWYISGIKGNQVAKPYNLALDRIADFTILDEGYVEAKSLLYENWFKDLIGIARYEGAKKYEIVIRTHSAYVHGLVKTKPFHSSQKEIKDFSNYDDGNYGEIQLDILLNTHYRNKELCGKLLTFGAELEVISPAILREELTREIHRLKELYL